MRITEYHAHLYFKKETLEEARVLASKIKEKFSLEHGKFHEKPVGPHKEWSCCFVFSTSLFGELIPWLILNRGSIDFLIHGVSGDDWKDHTDYAMWLGRSYELDLERFRPKGALKEVSSARA